MLTGIVAIIVTTVKFWDGAWLVLVLIPILVGMMSFIRRQYDGQEAELRVREDGVLPGPASRAAGDRPGQRHQPRGRPGDQLRARPRPRRARRLRHRRPRGGRRPARALGTPAPGRPAGHRRVAVPAVISPVVAYLDILDQAWPPDKEAPVTIVVLPEYVARHWWDRMLYNQTAKRLKAALVGREHTVIADVPYRRGH